MCGCLENGGGGSAENENRSPRTIQHSHVRHAPGGLETGRPRRGRAHGEQQAGAAPLTGAGQEDVAHMNSGTSLSLRKDAIPSRAARTHLERTMPAK